MARVRKINQNVEMTQNDYVEFVFTTYDLDGNKVDISGAVIVYEVNNGPHSVAALFSKSVGAGVTIAADQVANKGEWTVIIDPGDTVDLEGKLWHEAYISLGGKPVTAMDGDFKVVASRQR